jgi:formiminotetrahydrofolate cyclodeaminase
VEDPTDNLTSLDLRELNARLASREPVPGGGSAAALAGAMGASLVAMVAELTIGRQDAAAHDAHVRKVRDAAVTRQAELLDLAQDDAWAYGAVVAARHMPRRTDAEREARASAMRHTIVAAADVPLQTARAAAAVLELAREIAPIGNPNAVSDAGVAAALAGAAVRGAILNVRINLPYLDAAEPLRATAPAEIDGLASQSSEAERDVAQTVSARIPAS